jgi:site-specific DNA-adenine methylase
MSVAKLKVEKTLPYWPKKLLSESKIHGGKSYLCRRIFQHAPKTYSRFLDAYGGMGSMTYNAPAGLRQQVFVEKNYFRWVSKWVIKNRPKHLEAALRELQYNEETWKQARHAHDCDVAAMAANCLKLDEASRLPVAATYIALSKMSRGGMPECGFSWTPPESRLRGGQQAEKNSWEGMCDRIITLSDRLQNVILIHGQAEEQIVGLRNWDDPSEWFLYLDPTYLPAVRATNGTEYGADEMSHEQHEELVALVKDHPSKIAISHYPHKLYDGLGWHRVDFSMPNHSGQNKTKQRRTEALYMNY